jgi:DNA-binding transcriptional ArsR family regulator
MSMETAADANVAQIAGLIGEPSRAAVLMALIDGRALAASTLAEEAGVARSTISGHLGRLTDAGLVQVEASGRNRYYRLASAEVAETLESLARLAPPKPVSSLRQATRAHALRRARSCYDHLAGRLGVALTDALLERGDLVAERASSQATDPILGPGRAHAFHLTDAGARRLVGLGVEVEGHSRRPLIRYCVDWSEQRPHLGGALGAGLMEMLLDRQWLTRGNGRAILTTPAGEAALLEQFGIDAAALD